MTKKRAAGGGSNKMQAGRTKPGAKSVGAKSPAGRPAPKKAALKTGAPRMLKGKAKILSSELAFKGKVFSVYTEEVIEPGGVRAVRDVVRHSGSIVVLAVDASENAGDPMVVVERQFRHAANQFLLELPAGRIEPGEDTMKAAKRELIEETGYRAKSWEKLVWYFASPGFVGEWMEIWLATDITPGVAEPEEDERIEIRLVKLSELVKSIAAGDIHDGKTIIGALAYAERLRQTSN